MATSSQDESRSLFDRFINVMDDQQKTIASIANKVSQIEPGGGGSVNDFVGATDSTDGVHGLVPAPSAGEEDYYLKGDGTWSEVHQGGGGKYLAGTGIDILTEEVTSTTIPFEFFPKGTGLEEYIIHGTENGVGNPQYRSPVQEYIIPITITGENDTVDYNTTIIWMPNKLYEDDYIIHRNGITSFVQHKVDILPGAAVTVHSWINQDGSIESDSSESTGLRLTDYIEIMDDMTYQFVVRYTGGNAKWNVNVYDENQTLTRTITTENVESPIDITPTSSEKYFRISYTNWYNFYFYRIGDVTTNIPDADIQGPPFTTYPNEVNTVRVHTQYMPDEMYVKGTPPSEGSESDVNGVITNAGVINVTQEDQTALNKLTISFKGSSKTLTLPTGITPTEVQNMIDASLVPIVEALNKAAYISDPITSTVDAFSLLFNTECVIYRSDTDPGDGYWSGATNVVQASQKTLGEYLSSSDYNGWNDPTTPSGSKYFCIFFKQFKPVDGFTIMAGVDGVETGYQGSTAYGQRMVAVDFISTVKNVDQGNIPTLADLIDTSKQKVFPSRYLGYMITDLNDYSLIIPDQDWYINYEDPQSLSPVYYGIKTHGMFMDALKTTYMLGPNRTDTFTITTPSTVNNLETKTGTTVPLNIPHDESLVQPQAILGLARKTEAVDCTQAQYDALDPPSENTVYFITG